MDLGVEHLVVATLAFAISWYFSHRNEFENSKKLLLTLLRNTAFFVLFVVIIGWFIF